MSAPSGTASRSSAAPGSEASTEGRVHEDVRRLVEAGPVHLLMADAEAAAVHLGRVARSMRVPWVRVTPWALEASPDAAEALRLAMREAVVFRRRRLARVFAGRITRLTRLGEQRTSVAASFSNIPPSLLEVELETEEERRTVHLESAWAWNLEAAGAGVGDIVQIDMQDPLVGVLEGPEVPEGRVLDEREHFQEVSLGALDRAHAESLSGSPGPEEEKEAEFVSRALRSSAVVLSTGDLPPTGAQARVATDRWVRRRLSEKHTSLVAGFVAVVDAERLPNGAWAVLRASAGAPASPGFVLCEGDPDRFGRLVEGFPHAPRWDPLD